MPVPRGLSLYARDSFACAFAKGAAVTCWGTSIPLGMLRADAKAAFSSGAPVELGLRDVSAMAVGSAHACVVSGAGKVRCWGSNTFGELGDGTTEDRTTPVDVPLPAAAESIAIAVDTCAGLADGSLHCWGGAARKPKPVEGIRGVRRLVASTLHTCATTAEGRAYCWGNNDEGQLGTAPGMPSEQPRELQGVHDARDIAVSDASTCVLFATGTVRCFGQLSHAKEFGDGGASGTLIPGIDQANALFGGGGTYCARKGEQLLCWGNNEAGQIAPSREENPTPKDISERLR